MLCPVGLVGSGKTTVVKIISKKLNLLRISTDEIREIIYSKGFNLNRTAEITLLLVEKYLNKKYSIIIDADCIGEIAQKYIRKAEREKKVISIWIHINTSEKDILSRMKKNNLSKFFNSSRQAIENYKRRKPLHKKYLSKIKFYYEFSSFNDNIKRQIEQFIKKIKTDFCID